MSFTGTRLLAFEVAEFVFAADAALIQEILPPQPATRIPGAPEAVRGLINARGSLVTVIDGRTALGFSSGEGSNPVIVFEIGGKAVGLAVDGVLDLFAVSAEDLTPRRDLLGVDPSLVVALGRRADKSFVLLDVDTLVRPMMAA